MDQRFVTPHLSEPLRRLILCSPTALLLVDELGCVALINEYAATMFGYQRFDLEGLPLRVIIPDGNLSLADLPLVCKNLHDSIAASFANDHHLLAYKKDGSVITVETRATIIQIGASEYRYINVIDKSSVHSLSDLLKQTEIYKNIVTDELPLLIAYLDNQYRYKYVNQQYKEWSNLSQDQCIGRAMWEVSGWALFEKLRENVEKALQGEKRHFQTTVTYPKVGTRDVEVIYLPHFDDRKKVQGFFIVVSDISERKSLERERLAAKDRAIKMLLQSVSHFTWLADQNGNFTFVNAAWVRETGLGLEQCREQGWLAAICQEDQERVTLAWRAALLHKQACEGYARFRTRAGERYYHYMLMAVAGFEEETSWICILNDIDDSINLQEKLKNEKEIAEKANRAKTTFLANMSHEIRTPLAIIMNYVELLRDEELLSNERNQFLDTIRRNGQHLLELISDVLDLSRIEAERMDVRSVRFSLDTLLGELVASFAPEAAKKNISLSVHSIDPLPKEVRTDLKIIKQILVNVLGNSLKFTHTGFVRLNVTSDVDKEGQRLLVFSVKDSGIGIASEHHDKIFQPFMQADLSNSRSYEGSGLGLALSRDMARIMGGNVQLKESKPQLGSEFIISVPYDVVEPELERVKDKQHQLTLHSAREARCHRLCDVNVLIIEDNRDLQKALDLIFTSEGANVSIASNGQEGLSNIDHSTFDLVFMDLQMPVMDGYQTLSELRARNYQKPIIALTSHAFKQEHDKCMKKGFDDFLSKPVSREKLVEVSVKWVT